MEAGGGEEEKGAEGVAAAGAPGMEAGTEEEGAAPRKRVRAVEEEEEEEELSGGEAGVAGVVGVAREVEGEPGMGARAPRGKRARPAAGAEGGGGRIGEETAVVPDVADLLRLLSEARTARSAAEEAKKAAEEERDTEKAEREKEKAARKAAEDALKGEREAKEKEVAAKRAAEKRATEAEQAARGGRVRPFNPRIAPSAAKSFSECKRAQGEAGLVTYQFEGDDLSAMSVLLYHDVFERFCSNLRNAEPTPVDRQLLDALVGVMHVRYSQERVLRANLSTAFRQSQCLPQDAVVGDEPPWYGGCHPDLVISKGERRICIIEVKRESIAYSIAEVALYYQYLLVDLYARDKTQDKTAYYSSNWPTLLLVAAGHLLVAFGAVRTGQRTICEVLGTCWLLFIEHNGDIEESGARFMAAMRLALEELAALPGTPADRQPYRFPYRNTCQGITVQYVEELKQTSRWSPVYKATVTGVSEAGGSVKVDDTVAVKFIKGAYGFEAHRAMAEQGLAPKIYATEPGLWTMIIMEYIEGTTLHGQAADRLTEDTLEQLEGLLRALHDAKFVFGDFRLNNILVRKADGRLLLCDFDWAGQADKASYPWHLNSAIRWPDGVVKGGLIEAKHDQAWLARYGAGNYNEKAPEEAGRSQQQSSSSASRETSVRLPPVGYEGAGAPRARRRDAASSQRS
jgi:hypothetical protein